MISYSNKHQLPKWCISLFFFLPHVLWVHASPSFAVELKDNHSTLHKHTSIFRFKRQVCEDGTYQHGEICCLVCPAGQRLENDCTVRPDDGKCVSCVPGRTYNSYPNDKDSCEPCTHCDPNANQEEEKPCAITADTVCRCQRDHYCDKDRESCRICHPCLKCGSEGIKVDCTATNNTICSDKKPTGVNVAAAVLIPLCLILAAAAVILFYCWRKKKCFAFNFPGRVAEPANGEIHDVVGSQAEEMKPLKGVDLSSHLPDIASVLGWKVMRDLALRCGMSPTAIKSHQLNHPTDAEEQTLHLLSDWVEMQGSKAPETLIQMLRSMDRNNKADKVMAMIKRSGHSGGNSNIEQV